MTLNNPHHITGPLLKLCIVLLICNAGSTVNAQLYFDSDFENGRLDSSYQDAGAYVLAPVTNLHARMTGALDQSPVFKIFDEDGYRLRPYHHMVYRYEGDNTWHFFDTAYKDGTVAYYHFHNQSAFTADTVYIAYWYPYTYTDLQNYLSGIAGSPYLVDMEIVGTSYEGRNLYGYQITDTDYADCYKSNVVITARQHPVENINGYFVEGLTDYLLFSTDTIADFLRRNYRFYIYPMLNPDGVFNGSGQNALGQGLNREWEDSLLTGGTPEIDTIRPVIWEETGQKVDWSIDIHGNPGSNIPYYWWGYTDDSDVPAWQIDQALAYVQSVAMQDTSSPDGMSSYQQYIQGNGVSNSKTAANWFRKSFQAVAFTFEPTSEPMGPTGDNAYTIDQLKSAGSALAKGFYAVFDTVQALSGNISIGNDQLVALISGGHPPYTYEWTGPVNGTSDTLFYPESGLYSLVVTDSQGCNWQQSIEYTVNVAHAPDPVQPSFEVYPNPAADRIFIQSNISVGTAHIALYDISGRLLMHREVLLKDEMIFNLPVGRSGIYFLKIGTEEGVSLHRVVVNR